MNTEQINHIKKKLKHRLEPDRMEHTMGVAYTAASLAMRYDIDMEKAFMAGLLHDCAKHFSDEELLEKCKKRNISITEFELKQPDLLHAKLGAYLSWHKYGVQDSEIYHAIEYHTTGCTDMSMLDMIIYVADYIEPNRNKAPRLDYFRRLAFEDIRRCTYEILKGTIEYVSSKKYSLDTTTVAAYNSLKADFEE